MQRLLGPPAVHQNGAKSDMALDTVWIKLKRLFVSGLRRLRLTLLMQRSSQVVEDFGRIRAQRQRLPKAGDRFVEPAERLQRDPEIVVQFDRIGAQAQSPLEIGGCPLRLAEFLADIAEIVECIDRAGRQSERPLVTPHRLGSPTLRREDVAEIMVKRRVAAVARDRSLDMFDRIIGPALLMLDQPEQMQCWGMSGIDRQNQAANSFRLGRAAGALMGECGAKPAGDRRRPAAPILTGIAGPALRAALLSIHRPLIA